MKKFVLKLRNGIAKLLELPTQEQVNLLLHQQRELIESYDKLSSSFGTLQNDMKVLYGEVSQDIKRVDRKVAAIKPVLKVEDKEAVQFIKGILSKHDNSMNTQQQFLEHKKLELQELEGKARKAVNGATEASAKLNNVLDGLGLGRVDDPKFVSFRELIIEKTKERISENA